MPDVLIRKSTATGAYIEKWIEQSDGSHAMQTSTSGGSAPVSSGTPIDRSGTITTGGTAQNAIVANSSRTFLLLENPSTATEPLYFSTTGTATVNSRVLYPGDSYVPSFVPVTALSVFAATTGHAWIAQEA